MKAPTSETVTGDPRAAEMPATKMPSTETTAAEVTTAEAATHMTTAETAAHVATTTPVPSKRDGVGRNGGGSERHARDGRESETTQP
jgi:hypothetical protein